MVRTLGLRSLGTEWLDAVVRAKEIQIVSFCFVQAVFVRSLEHTAQRTAQWSNCSVKTGWKWNGMLTLRTLYSVPVGLELELKLT